MVCWAIRGQAVCCSVSIVWRADTRTLFYVDSAGRSMHTTRAILDYVHTYFWGEAPVISIRGGKYLLTFSFFLSHGKKPSF